MQITFEVGKQSASFDNCVTGVSVRIGDMQLLAPTFLTAIVSDRRL